MTYKKLLSTNHKLSKQESRWHLSGLSFAPNDQSGHNVCTHSTPACRKACVLWYSGRTNSPSVRKAMIARTLRFFKDRKQFLTDLHLELSKHASLGRDGKPVYARLNTASDIPWELIDPTLFDHPIVFYDYTKIATRWLRQLNERTIPDNYQLTYSWSEESRWETVKQGLDRGLNCAVVFDTEYNPQHGRIGKLPKTWRGYKVVNGDRHDVRIRRYDGRGRIIGLRGKGGGKIVQDGLDSGFIQAG